MRPTLYTGPTRADLDRMPVVLTALPQWVLFQLLEVPDAHGELKLPKVPINAHTLGNASSTAPATWDTFSTCATRLPTALATWDCDPPTTYQDKPATYQGGGLGFVFTADDPYMLVDLDKSVDPATDTLTPTAQTIVDTLHSYTQRSVSGTGLHVLVQAQVPTADKQHGPVQMWHEKRFVAMTGWHVEGTPATIEPRQSQLTMVHAAHILMPKVAEAAQKAATRTTAPHVAPATGIPRLTDQEILTLASRAKNSAKFHALWGGDTAGYDTPREADEALLCLLAFYTRDAEQLESLFRQSNLCDTKWEKRTDYRERSITKALTHVTAQYDPGTYAAEQKALQQRTGQQQRTAPRGSDLPRPQHDDAAYDLPAIQITTDVATVVDAAIHALEALTPTPVLYQRARALRIIARHGPPPKWLRRQADTPIIQEASPAHLWELLATAAPWEKYDARSEDWRQTTPPRWVVEVIQGREQWPFPVLEGLVCSPTLRPDGSLLVTPGYDPDTGLYLDFNGTTFPTIPSRPTFDEARSALGQLQEVFIDFPLAVRDEHAPQHHNPYLSAIFAAVLTVVGRAAIQGNIPLFGITATAAGSGKGKIVDAIALIGTGRCAPKMGQTLDDNEELKRLLALALEGASVCCIDNVTHPLGNQFLDMALTAQTITGRILGQNVTGEAPWNAVMFATGNNLAYRGDMARRVVPIALDPKMEKPEERSGFQHPNLEQWVRKERPRLVVAALTILRAYFVAGCPAQPLTLYGSFEAWSDVIRSAVVWLGEADPCEGRQDIAAQTDEAYERLATLLAAWEACYPGKAEGTPQEKTLNQIKQEIALYAANKDQVPTTWDTLRDALTPFDRRSDGKTLNTHLIGNALRTVDGRVIGQKRLKRCGEYRHNALWRVETV